MNVKLNKISQDLLEAVKSSATKGTEPYDTTAEVIRVDGETAWVHIAGGVDETPVRKTIDCKKSDLIQIRVGGGDAWITGNVTAPPTDDTKVIEVEKETEKIAKSVEVIGEVAGNTNQYFWHTESGTDTGAHITEIPREQFLKNPEKGGWNTLMRSLGFAIRNGLKEYLIALNDKIRIGLEEDCYAQIESNGFTLVDYDGTDYVELKDLRVIQDVEMTHNYISSGSTRLNTTYTVKSIVSVYINGIEVQGTVISSEKQVTLPYAPQLGDTVILNYITETFAANFVDTFTGDGTTTSFDLAQIAINTRYSVTVDGVEAQNVTKSIYHFTFANAPNDGAEIVATYVSNSSYAKAYSLGTRTGNKGAMSTVLGHENTASGIASLAVNRGTIANSDYQSVFGCFNKPINATDEFDVPLILVGGGRSNANRFNAFAVTRRGDIRTRGNLYINCDMYDLSGGIGPIDDVVIEEEIGYNTEDWNYRKWANGTSECWGKFVDNTPLDNSVVGGYASTAITPVAFPTGLFIAIPEVQCSIYAGTIVCWPVSVASPSTSNVGNWRAFRLTSSSNTNDRVFNFYCIGKWK